MAYNSSKKIDFTGCRDSTPSSTPERDPNDQPDRDGKKVDWKGMSDGTPGSGTDRDPG